MPNAIYPAFSPSKEDENIWRHVPDEEIAHQLRSAERRGDTSITGDEQYDNQFLQEIRRRGGEREDLFKLFMADLGVTGAQIGMDLAGKAQNISSKLPYVGSALGAAQAIKTQSAMHNPYGRGEPTGEHIFNDIAENSLGYAARLGVAPMVLAQGLAGGMLSEKANLESADVEYPEVAKLIAAGDYDTAERLMLGEKSRHWNRNKVSNLFSGKIQSVEDERREKWKSQYGMETNPSKKRSMLETELNERKHYDMAQGFAPWIESAIMGARMMAADKGDEEAILKNWTSGMAQFEKDWLGGGSNK